MNESTGDQVAEMLGTHLDFTEENLDSTDDAFAEPPVSQDREGLPRSFRMRHDAHYVDELMSRAAGHETVVRTPTPALTPASERPEQIVNGDTAPDAPLPPVGLIADRLESIVAHASASRSSAAASLIEQSVQIELVRVARLARAAAILQLRESPVRESVFAHEIADGITRAAAPVARIAGMEFDVSIDDRAFEIAVDAAAVIQAIAGTVDALVDLQLSSPRRQPARSAGRIAISLQSVKVRPALILEVFCPTLSVSGAKIDRFFRNLEEDYRSAPAAGVLFAAAAQTVRAHGGRADIKQHAAGATITYVYPHTA